MNRQIVGIDFDVTFDYSQIIIGMDIKRYKMTENLKLPSHMILCRPKDKMIRSLQTYISGGAINSRLRLKSLPIVTEALIGTNNLKEQATSSATLTNRINHITHDPNEQDI